MAKNRAKVIKLAKFREAQQANDGIRALEEESGSNCRSRALLRKPRKSRRPLRHWTFKGWTAPSPFLAEMMRSPLTAPSMQRGTAMLESGALAYRRLENGEIEVLLVSKKRSKRWGIPKGRVNASLSFGETAAKEAFEEAGVIGRVSPNSVGMFRAKKATPIAKIVEVWVYLIEVDEMLDNWPEKEKRQIRWVSCRVAARELRNLILIDLCHHLARS
jgi:ADP-ribose pyrophosphatase YjhB (NUDIX family)